MQEGELFHGMGEWAWAAGIAPLLGPWRLGAVQLVYQREGGFDPHRQLDVLSRHGATNVFTTPTAMRSMMGIGDAGTRYPQKFRVVCSAGEPLNPEAIRWFRDQYGLTVLDYYGLTESYPLVANYPFLDVREGSMGKPMPGWDVAILDEDERPMPAGERGEICLRARSNPHYPLGYWNNEEASQETFGGEWFHTKDAARFDEDGYVWYEGRADDVIIAAGYRIGPFEVESACLEHPAVAEAAAVASPDERRGNVVKAFIVCAAGVEPSDAVADGDPDVRARAARGARVPAPDRVHRRAAEDADGQDPPDRAAPGGASAQPKAAGAFVRTKVGWPPQAHAILGPVEASVTAHRRPPALLPPMVARLGGFAALALLGALQWQRMVEGLSSGRALLWVLVAVLAAVAVLRADSLRRFRGPATLAVVPLSLLAAYAASGLPLVLLKPRRIDELGAGLSHGAEALSSVQLPYAGADPWPTDTLLLLGVAAVRRCGAAGVLAARGRQRATRSSRWRCC